MIILGDTVNWAVEHPFLTIFYVWVGSSALAFAAGSGWLN